MMPLWTTIHSRYWYVKRSFLLYARMSRPSQLLAVALVYAWGALVAAVLMFDGLNWTSLLTGLGPLLLISASIHYANEYADHETDALTVRTPFSGGSGALADYGARPVQALKAAWVTLVLGSFIAGLLAWSGALPLLTILLLALGAAGGWMYSLRPLALAWRGWGELDNAFLGGVLLPVFGFAVQSGVLDLRIILLALPFGIHVFVNLLATTWADRRADGLVGKYTLATRWTTSQLRLLYFLVIFAAYVLLWVMRGWLVPPSLFALTLALLPMAIFAGWTYTRWHTPFPSVLVMVLFVTLQLLGWSILLFA